MLLILRCSCAICSCKEWVTVDFQLHQPCQSPLTALTNKVFPFAEIPLTGCFFHFCNILSKQDRKLCKTQKLACRKICLIDISEHFILYTSYKWRLPNSSSHSYSAFSITHHSYTVDIIVKWGFSILTKETSERRLEVLGIKPPSLWLVD